MPLKKTYKKKYTPKKNYKALTVRKVKTIAKKTAIASIPPRKHHLTFQFTNSLSTVSLYHDNLYIYDLKTPANTSGIFGINESTSSTNTSDYRLSDIIYTTGMRYRGVFQIPYDRRNLIMKMWLVEYNSIQGAPSTYDEFFDNVSGNSLLDSIDHKRFRPKLLFKGSVSPKDRLDASSDATILIDKWIPFKRTIKYSDGVDGNVVMGGCKEALALVVTFYDTISSSSTTDVICNNNENLITLYYRNNV